MSLTPEWIKRIDAWRAELGLNCFRPLNVLELEGFTTLEQLALDQALGRTFRPFPTGTAWGAKWEYGWFRTRVRLPAEARGKRIAARINMGGSEHNDHHGEALVYVNGRIAGSRDPHHREITLSRSGRAGAAYEIVAEAYAGHGPRECHGGPVSDMRVSVAEPPPAQCVVGRSELGIWEEEIYQLCIDIDVLRGVRDSIDPDSLRVARIDEAFRQLTFVVELESGYDTMIETVRQARGLLAPLLQCTNGSTAPTLFAFGHAHLDVAWLWPLAETERKVARTFSNQLALIDEYPEYRFLNSQAHLYRMLKQRYPRLYARVKKAVKNGAIIAEGGMWVEADTNISGGEALIRQFLHGKRFFREEFGVDNELLWLPDVFGYSGALPQIMAGCGIKYFGTAKIFWTYNGGEPFPHNTFVWQGIDGTGVQVHLLNNYSSQTYPAQMIGQWNGRRQKDGFSTRPVAFGYGDGGGGANRTHLELLRRQADLEGAPRVKMASPLDYYHDQQRRGMPDVTCVGELYFQAHRGTYTSQARTKNGNRRCELALREAELWGCAARALAGYRFNRSTLDEAWKAVLLNQFHDVLPGSSIARVYAEAEAAYAGVLEQCDKTGREARAKLAGRGDGLTVFNSLGWERRAIVVLPDKVKGLTNDDGSPAPVQRIGRSRVAEVTVPSCGWASYAPGQPGTIENNLRASVAGLENELLRVRLNKAGEITEIFDKQTGRELTAGVCNRFRMFKDVPSWFDAWDIDSMYRETPVALESRARVTVAAEGPLLAAVRVERTLHESPVTQEIRLRRGSRRIDFVTTIDWQERHKMLKVCFPVAVHADEAVSEIQFGHIGRPNHGTRPFDADRYEVSNHRWTALREENRGCAVLNDCKYGVNVAGNSIDLTLLRSPLAPDPCADRGVQELTYSFYCWNGPFAECDVVREGYDLNVPVVVEPGLAATRSLFAVDAPNVVIETVKPAEDKSGDIVVRLYESKRCATQCTLSTSLPVASAEETNMLELTGRKLRLGSKGIALTLRPFEIKTVRFALA
ncbi:MAG: alpha-mannosidase [Chitinivibrionales bacterium]|nr:alpha-mannosidase [Chitinivibrionales bacterium]